MRSISEAPMIDSVHDMTVADFFEDRGCSARYDQNGIAMIDAPMVVAIRPTNHAW